MEFKKETRYFLDAIAQICQMHGIKAINVNSESDRVRAIKKDGGSIEFGILQEGVYYGVSESHEGQTYHAELGDEY